MSISLAILIVLVAFFAFRGYRKGLFNSVTKISSLIGGYAAAIFYVEPVNALLESWIELQGLVAFFTASTILFLGAFSLVSLVFLAIRKSCFKNERVSTVSAFSGAVIGSVVGSIIAIIIVWMLTFVSEMRPVAAGQVLAQKPVGVFEGFAKHSMGKILNIILLIADTEPEVRHFSQALIESPGEVSQQVQRLNKSGELKVLFGDSSNQLVLNSGDAAAVQKLPDFQALAKNPDMLALAKSAGMLGETGDDFELAETELALQTTQAWVRIQQVKDNQRVQAIMNDPEFLATLQSGNPIDLLTNSRLLELANIIFAESSGTLEPSAVDVIKASTKIPNKALKKEMKIYSWTDDMGRIHYSDVDPEPKD